MCELPPLGRGSFACRGIRNAVSATASSVTIKLRVKVAPIPCTPGRGSEPLTSCTGSRFLTTGCGVTYGSPGCFVKANLQSFTM